MAQSTSTINPLAALLQDYQELAPAQTGKDIVAFINPDNQPAVLSIGSDGYLYYFAPDIDSEGTWRITKQTALGPFESLTRLKLGNTIYGLAPLQGSSWQKAIYQLRLSKGSSKFTAEPFNKRHPIEVVVDALCGAMMTAEGAQVIASIPASPSTSPGMAFFHKDEGYSYMTEISSIPFGPEPESFKKGDIVGNITQNIGALSCISLDWEGTLSSSPATKPGQCYSIPPSSQRFSGTYKDFCVVAPADGEGNLSPASVFALGTDQRIYQALPYNPTASGDEPLSWNVRTSKLELTGLPSEDGGSPGLLPQQLVSIYGIADSAGTVNLFFSDANGEIWHTSRQLNSDAWSAVVDLGIAPAQLTLLLDLEGRPEIVASMCSMIRMRIRALN